MFNENILLKYLNWFSSAWIWNLKEVDCLCFIPFHATANRYWMGVIWFGFKLVRNLSQKQLYPNFKSCEIGRITFGFLFYNFSTSGFKHVQNAQISISYLPYPGVSSADSNILNVIWAKYKIMPLSMKLLNGGNLWLQKWTYTSELWSVISHFPLAHQV